MRSTFERFLTSEFLTSQEAAIALGVTKKHVYNLISRGRLTPLRDYGRVRGPLLLDSEQVRQYGNFTRGKYNANS